MNTSYNSQVYNAMCTLVAGQLAFDHQGFDAERTINIGQSESDPWSDTSFFEEKFKQFGLILTKDGGVDGGAMKWVGGSDRKFSYKIHPDFKITLGNLTKNNPPVIILNEKNFYDDTTQNLISTLQIKRLDKSAISRILDTLNEKDLNNPIDHVFKITLYGEDVDSYQKEAGVDLQKLGYTETKKYHSPDSYYAGRDLTCLEYTLNNPINPILKASIESLKKFKVDLIKNKTDKDVYLNIFKEALINNEKNKLFA